jgi:hypothetical protein
LPVIRAAPHYSKQLEKRSADYCCATLVGASVRMVIAGVCRAQALALECVQPSWPQVHIISVLLAMPSQWALQYFCFSGGMQLQAALAHFFVFAMSSLQPGRCLKSRHCQSLGDYDADLLQRDGDESRRFVCLLTNQPSRASVNRMNALPS